MTRATKFFKALAWKRLRSIDLPNRGSNQHELQGINGLKVILGTQGRKHVRALWRAFDADGDLISDCSTDLTWYDAREGNPDRNAEWRLYFRSDTPLESAQIGDLLLAAQPHADAPFDDCDIVLYVIPWDSPLRAEVMSALQLGDPGRAVQTADEEVLANAQLLALHEEVLRTLEPFFQKLAEPADIEEAVKRHFAPLLASPSPAGFPASIELAKFAQSLATTGPRDDPDAALTQVLNLETRSYHVLENLLLAGRIAKPFASVEVYLKTAMSDLNRRKSRRGSSFEHQLEWVFRTCEVPFVQQVKPDGTTKVDFLFPSLEAYEALPPQAPADCGVFLLSLKSKVRERWGQLSREARRLTLKHLGTLDPDITDSQFAEMKAAGIEVVVPKELHARYGTSAGSILSVADFLELVRRGVRGAR